MRLLGILVLVGLISAAVAETFNYAVTYWTPCQGERLACTMDGIGGSLANLALSVVAMIVFGILLFWRPTIRALTFALIGLFAPVAALLILTLQTNSRVHDGLLFYWREIQQLLQFVGGPALVIVIQWSLLTVYLSRATQPAKAS